MPIKVTIETKNDAFPDTGTKEEYLAAVRPVLEQVNRAVEHFAEHRVDGTTVLKDRAGQPCGSIEILRF